MKKLNYSLKPLVVVVGLLLLVSGLHAQRKEFINANNLNAGIAVGGNMFSDSIIGYNNSNFFELPKGSGKALLFTQALWMTCYDNIDTLHVAANRYFDYGHDFFDGPIVNTYTSAYDSFYKRVFKISRAQVNTFRALSFPVSASQVDTAILHWPGKGNPNVQQDFGVNIASPLAPFVDVNNNGIYEPLLGDYPAFCGEQAIFFVYNDARAAHGETGGHPLGVEIRALATEFVDSSNDVSDKNALNNTLFVHYEIENKSGNNYTNYRLGMWTDPDVGCFSNDYAGCDTVRDLMFAYNGVASDPDCSPENGYGLIPVAVGVKFLNSPLSAFTVFTGQGASSAALSDPSTSYQYQYFLTGLWGDSTHIEHGGTGYNSGGGNTNFMYTGDPADTTAWSEPTAINIPGDRRMVGAARPLNFAAGEIKQYDFAFFGSYDTTVHSTFIRIVDTLKRDGDIIQNFYNTQLLPCQATIASGINNVSSVVDVNIYPNPAASNVTIDAPAAISQLQVYDIEGRLLLNQQPGVVRVTLPVNTLAKGVYLISIKCTSGSVLKKLVVE